MRPPRPGQGPAPDDDGRWLTFLLSLYPRAFRGEYGAAMRQLVRDQRRALGAAGPLAVARFWGAVAWDVVRTAPREHCDAVAPRVPALVTRGRRAHTPEAPVLLAALNVLVALLLGFGAVQELVVLGVGQGQTQPFVVGAAGTLVSLLLALSGVAIWRRWPTARRLTIAAALLSVAFHVGAALPPHRNVGLLALLIGAGYGVVLLTLSLRSSAGPPPRAAADQHG